MTALKREVKHARPANPKAQSNLFIEMKYNVNEGNNGAEERSETRQTGETKSPIESVYKNEI